MNLDHGATMLSSGRRLSDKILAAFEQACDSGQHETAVHLVHALEATLTRSGGKPDRREDVEAIAAAYARLEALRAALRAA